jgi:hypothetical protein
MRASAIDWPLSFERRLTSKIYDQPRDLVLQLSVSNLVEGWPIGPQPIGLELRTSPISPQVEALERGLQDEMGDGRLAVRHLQVKEQEDWIEKRTEAAPPIEVAQY